MTKNNFYKQIIQNRQKVILELIKKGGEINEIEREIALLALDIINGLRIKAISLKEGCKCFIKIDYSIGYKLGSELSDDITDLLNEGMILDELGITYGADLNLMIQLANKILSKGKKLSQPQIRTFASLTTYKHKSLAVAK